MNLFFQRRMQAQPILQYLLAPIFFILFFFVAAFAHAQNTAVQYADAVLSEVNVTASANSIDANPATYSELEAGTGIIIGIGSYSSHIEMAFPGIVPANQTSYVRIETTDNILSSLMGGSLGNLLSGIAGVALIGNQEFLVEARFGSTPVLSGNSTNPSSFSGERLKVVVDVNNHTYLAITPNQDYQSIRITNFVGSLVPLGTRKYLRVWDPYYVVQGSSAAPQFTSYDASGITLELLNLGGGMSNLERAIDGNEASHSSLDLGVVSVTSNITQRVYFEGLLSPLDTLAVRLRIDPALLAITLGQGIRIRTQNGAIVATNQTLQSLLTPADLAALQNGQPVTVYVQPYVPVDRLVVELNGILGVAVAQALEVYEVFIPYFDITANAQPVAGGSVVCNPSAVRGGGSTTCTATPNVGYQFNSWSGDCGGTALSCTLESVTVARTVVAEFAPLLEQELTLPEGPQAGEELRLAIDDTDANEWLLAEAQLQPVTALPEPLPAQVTMPHGLVSLRLVLGDQGSDATVVLTYPQPFPPGTVYYKYGPTLADPTPHWYEFPQAQISGNTITLTLTDGGAGDSDLTANGEISDPGGPVIFAPLLEQELTLPEGQQAGEELHLAINNTNAWQLAEAQALATTALAEPPPAGITLPHGVVSLRLVSGDQGSDATVVLTYPQPFPSGTVYYKYGPTLANPTPHWYVFPRAQISGNTITLTLTDGGAGDSDLTADSEINDPGGPAILANAHGGALAAPTLSEWAKIVLVGVMAVLGLAAMRRRRLAY